MGGGGGDLLLGGQFSVPVRDGVRRRGLTLETESEEEKLSKIVHWGQKCPPPYHKICANFGVLSIKYNFLMQFWSKIVVKIERKLRLNFWHLREQNSVGGHALVKKRGRWLVGATGKIFATCWGPSSPQSSGKNPEWCYIIMNKNVTSSGNMLCFKKIPWCPFPVHILPQV